MAPLAPLRMAASNCTTARGAARLSGEPLPFVGKSNRLGVTPMPASVVRSTASALATVRAPCSTPNSERLRFAPRFRLTFRTSFANSEYGGETNAATRLAAAYEPRAGNRAGAFFASGAALTVTPAPRSACTNAMRANDAGSSTRKTPTNCALPESGALQPTGIVPLTLPTHSAGQLQLASPLSDS